MFVLNIYVYICLYSQMFLLRDEKGFLVSRGVYPWTELFHRVVEQDLINSNMEMRFCLAGEDHEVLEHALHNLHQQPVNVLWFGVVEGLNSNQIRYVYNLWCSLSIYFQYGIQEPKSPCLPPRLGGPWKGQGQGWRQEVSGKPRDGGEWWRKKCGPKMCVPEPGAWQFGMLFFW